MEHLLKQGGCSGCQIGVNRLTDWEEVRRSSWKLEMTQKRTLKSRDPGGIVVELHSCCSLPYGQRELEMRVRQCRRMGPSKLTFYLTSSLESWRGS